MKFSLPLLLLLPLHAAVAQYRPIYSTPRPSYTPPRTTYTPPSNYNYQQQQRSQQQAHETFQRMQTQQVQQMQQQMFRNQQRDLSQQQWQRQFQLQMQLLRRPLSPEQLAKNQERQQQAEQKAAEQLAQLTQEQQRRRTEHPAATPEEAAAQQQADTRQLNALAVKTYREVYLPGQLQATLQSLALPEQAQQRLQALNHDLLDNKWWDAEAAQAPAKVAAYGTTLAALTTDLLGFDLASPPSSATPLSTGALDEQLAHDTFDRLATEQLFRAAAENEKRAAGARLAQAVQEFRAVATQAAASPQPPQDLKQQRNAVKKSLHHVNQELARYQAQVGSTGSLAQTQKAILKSTKTYLTQNKG